MYKFIMHVYNLNYIHLLFDMIDEFQFTPLKLLFQIRFSTLIILFGDKHHLPR